MSSLSTALLYSNSAANELARQAYATQLRGQEDAVAASLKHTYNAAPAGTTITARYQYKVGEDGALYPTETHITTDANELQDTTQKQGRRAGNFLRQQQDSRRQNLADISKPRALLSPTDELELFSTSVNASPSTIGAAEPAVAQTVASATLQGEAIEEDGTPVEVQSLPPQGQFAEAAQESGAQVLTLAGRAQQSVANLYARNNDIVYNESPLSELAA